MALAARGGGLLRGHSTYTRDEPGTLITVLELQRDRAEISTQTLTALTPREREVALLVVDGCSDRQVAERLHLSHHTVSQSPVYYSTTQTPPDKLSDTYRCALTVGPFPWQASAARM